MLVWTALFSCCANHQPHQSLCLIVIKKVLIIYATKSGGRGNKKLKHEAKVVWARCPRFEIPLAIGISHQVNQDLPPGLHPPCPRSELWVFWIVSSHQYHLSFFSHQEYLARLWRKNTKYNNDGHTMYMLLKQHSTVSKSSSSWMYKNTYSYCKTMSLSQTGLLKLASGISKSEAVYLLRFHVTRVSYCSWCTLKLYCKMPKQEERSGLLSLLLYYL